ncbi:MAG: beta-propeller fold lactonase family protein [Deltaproteobacteria bacterium]|nr:beta-propeller fold lactonase family protein [Deltaproteobacteria bacterium]
MRRLLVMRAIALLTFAACAADPSTGTSLESTTVPTPSNNYTLFESLQTRPLAISPNGKLLFACNTPDNRLEIFKIGPHGLDAVASVSVGLEPVAVAVRSEDEVWVVNHLSDSVSIVKVDGASHTSHVIRTLLVGDEPRDIVFAHDRAFITTAHRGQSSPDDPGLFDPTTGRADVWVFDANQLGSSAGGDRIGKVTLFADSPRALAVSPDGNTVYAAPFMSGNQTTVVSDDAVRQVYASRLFNGNRNIIIWPGQYYPQPLTGLIVKWNGSHWMDPYGTPFDPFVRVSLPDYDVFAINATTLAQTAAIPHVGTTLFNMAVNPATGKVFVSNTDAHNNVRFEGPTPGSVRGQIVDSRISVVDPTTGAVTHNNLNSHIVNGQGDASISRAFPQDLAFTRDGSTLYAVAQGSSKLIWYPSSALEAGTAAPSASNQLTLTGGGATGVVLDEKHGNAYVLTRFDNGISTVDLGSKTEVAHDTMFNPEPAKITNGRRYLYDATFTSANGTQACASCHIGGDMDQLSWDLGNPAGAPLPITKSAASGSLDEIFATNPNTIISLIPAAAPEFDNNQFLKGPMTTQSLRGMDNHGAMHWRGDRNGAIQQDGTPFLDGSGQPVKSAQPNAGIFDEARAFESFNVAFPGLVGRTAQLSADDMTAFRTFILEETYPPNPIRNLDDSLTPTQAAGAAFYFNHAANGQELPSDRLHNCNGCHVLDRNGNAGATDHPGFFGTDGRLSFENEPQVFKVPHLRNEYQKIGMFGSSLDRNIVGTVLHLLNPAFPETNPAVPAVRGFGYQHDGALGTLEHFFTAQVFIKTTQPGLLDGAQVPANPFGIPLFTFDSAGNITGLDVSGFSLRRAIVAYILAFDSNLRPIVGQQVTLNPANRTAAQSRIALLEARAAAGDCDLVVKGIVEGRERGAVYSGGVFVSAYGSLTDAQLQALVGSKTDALTFTAVPPGSGWRIGLDRNADGLTD